jgi:membrane protein required for colicin V production
VSGFDYVILLIVTASLAIGAWRGLVGEILSLLAWVLAVLAAWWFGAELGQALYQGIEDGVLRLVAGYATVVVLVFVAMALVRLALRGLLKALGLSVTDRLLGVVFGIVRGLAVVLVLVAAGGMTSAPQQSWWRDATLAAPLETAVLAMKPWLPPELAKRIRFA